MNALTRQLHTALTAATFISVCLLSAASAAADSASNHTVSEQTTSANTTEAATPHYRAPLQFHNIYKASYYGFTITVTHDLEPLDDHGGYKMRFFADSMLASIEEISRFKWLENHTVQPHYYTYERKGLGRNRHAELSFDWDKNQVINNVADKPWKMSIHPGVIDKLSFQVQLQQDLIAGKTDNLVYDIADGGHIKEYTFAIVGHEKLATPLGKIDTVKVERTRKDSDRVTYVWMAPKYDYLLVRMQQEEGGDSYTIYIHQAEINHQKISHF